MERSRSKSPTRKSKKPKDVSEEEISPIGITTIKSEEDMDDIMLVRRKPKKKLLGSPPKISLESLIQPADIIAYSEFDEPSTKGVARLREIASIPENIIESDAVIKGMEGKKKFTIQAPKVKKVKSPPKKFEETKYNQNECEKFIEASKNVGLKEKFLNPITGKLITKGSASYNKYLKDCEPKLTVETSTLMKKEKIEKKDKFGIHKIYRCEDYPQKSGKPFVPNPHQIKAQNRFRQILEEPEPKNQRGLLLYYGLGSGKTCTYAMIADLYRRTFPDRHVFIFTPGSLRTNFLEQYCSFCGLDPKEVEKNFIFFTLNDTNILRKLPKNFNESLVIIDEVHKLTHAKANESSVISMIYDTINNSKNMHIVSGSGTPIETNIEELYYLTNLHLVEQFPYLSDFKKSFTFADKSYFIPKNKNDFIETYSSYISYYDPEKQMMDKGVSGFPKVYQERVEVPINPDRETKLIEVVDLETERMKPPNENLKFSDPERYRKLKSMYFIATSRLVSGQLSNYVYPKVNVGDLKNAIKVPLTKEQKEQEKMDQEFDIAFKIQSKKDEKEKEKEKIDQDFPIELEEGADKEIVDELLDESSEKGTAVGLRIIDLPKEDGGWITDEQLNNLYEDGGEKIEEIINDIVSNEGKHAVYTRFKTYYGSRLLGSLLELKGIPFVFFDGDMDDKDRINVLERFNSPANIEGDKIKVIILTSAGSAGINLKEIRRFHILEQYFNLSYLKQVVGRGVRYLSHERLPEAKRNITIRNYFLDLSTPEITKSFSPDFLSYESGKSKDLSISKVREIIQSFGV
jgi:superfamily II DNA or RNA helicase